MSSFPVQVNRLQPKYFDSIYCYHIQEKMSRLILKVQKKKNFFTPDLFDFYNKFLYHFLVWALHFFYLQWPHLTGLYRMNLKDRKTKKPIPLPWRAVTIFIIFIVFSVHSLAIDEYAIKSTIIYKILKFTQWPQPVDKNKPFTISILGKTSPGKEIKMPQDETIDKRRIVVRKIRHLSEIGTSDVLFITANEAHRIDAILDYIRDKPILTVGDTPGFGQKGVIINLYVYQNSVRFEINYKASKKASLEIHSQLFTTGRVVKTDESF